LEKDFKRLFKKDIFAYKFAIVRDPVSRLLSAYNHNRKRIGRLVTFDAFLARLERNFYFENDFFGAVYDNHFVPANRFVPKECEVFYLKNGLTDVEIKLRELTKTSITLSCKKNVRSYNLDSTSGLKGAIRRLIVPPSPQKASLNNDTIIRIKNLYEEDYRRFFQ
jgi:hypothetical protein